MALSEPHSELEPVFGLQGLPGTDTLVVDVFRIGVKEGGGAGGGKALQSHLFQTENLLVEAFLGALPGERCQLVGPAELPQVAVGDILLLAANLEVLREGRGAAEDRNAGALAGVIDRNPANAAHLVGEPGAQLRDVTVGAPGNGDGAAELHCPGGKGIEGVPEGGGEPGIGDGAHDCIGRMLLGGGTGQLDVLGHVKIRPLVGLPVEGHHLTDIHGLIRLHGEGELVHVVGESERRC